MTPTRVGRITPSRLSTFEVAVVLSVHRCLSLFTRSPTQITRVLAWLLCARSCAVPTSLDVRFLPLFTTGVTRFVEFVREIEFTRKVENFFHTFEVSSRIRSDEFLLILPRKTIEEIAVRLFFSTSARLTRSLNSLICGSIEVDIFRTHSIAIAFVLSFAGKNYFIMAL